MPYTEKYITKLVEEHASAQSELETLVLKTIAVGQVQEDERVRDYMLHGVGRRINVLRHCLKTIFELFPPETTKPLGTDRLHEVQINLHAFVMNLYGLFENWAWAFVARHRLEGAIGGRTKVGLFLESTQQHLPEPLKSYLTSPTMTAWHNSYLKNYRDALAHRIPLYIPPARYTDEQAAHDKVLDAEEYDCIRTHRWDELERVRAERSELGFAFPVFLHSFVGGDRLRYVQLHPQLLCDIKTVLEFGPLYFAHWHKRTNPSQDSVRPKRSIDDFENEDTLYSLSGEYLQASMTLYETPAAHVKVDMVDLPPLAVPVIWQEVRLQG